MTGQTFAVETVELDCGWHWYTTRGEGGPLVLWNATPYPTMEAAAADALSTHIAWQETGNTFPYGKSQL